MTYQLLLQPYQHPFRYPLKTAHGTWDIREGLWVGLQDADGAIGWGEIAPLPWFGTETVAEALAYCQQMPTQLSEADIQTIPNHLPASQFGFGSAWEALMSQSHNASDWPPHCGCALLPTGDKALTAWPNRWNQGYRTFKLKIGVHPIDTELAQVRTLAAALPGGVKLRLDANGSLTLAQAQRWLDCCDRLPHAPIEYLEQPLPPSQLTEMMALSQQFATPLALDESVATLAQLQQIYAQGWRSVVVIKAAIAGYPQLLRDFLQTHPIDAVFSSVFETEVGRAAALNLAQAFQSPHRAIGFGTEDIWQHSSVPKLPLEQSQDKSPAHVPTNSKDGYS
ncbi:MAG TPA: o-succinylbenzoate synthase [Stenomitos sp.]